MVKFSSSAPNEIIVTEEGAISDYAHHCASVLAVRYFYVVSTKILLILLSLGPRYIVRRDSFEFLRCCTKGGSDSSGNEKITTSSQ